MYDYAFERVLFDDRSSQLDQVVECQLAESNDGQQSGSLQIDSLQTAGIDMFG
jgi:hypothetical protein